MNIIIESIIPVTVLVFFAVKCVRLKPEFRILSPFDPETEIFFRKGSTSKTSRFLPILILIFGIPLVLFVLSIILSGGKIRMVDADKVIKERYLVDIKAWLPNEAYDKLGVLMSINHDMMKDSGNIIYKAKSKSDKYITLYYETDSDFKIFTLTRIINGSTVGHQTVWKGNLTLNAERTDTEQSSSAKPSNVAANRKDE